MQKAILVLQIVILLIFLIVGFYFINELNKLSTEIENALVLIEEIRTYMPKLKKLLITLINWNLFLKALIDYQKLFLC